MQSNVEVLLLRNGCRVVIDPTVYRLGGVRVLFKPASVKDKRWRVKSHQALIIAQPKWKGGAWGTGFDVVKVLRKPLKSKVAAKTSLNKRSAAPKTTPKSAKRRLRTA